MPQLPLHFLGRRDVLEPLKQTLLHGGDDKIGITGTTLRVGVQGMGGIGKSVLTAALAHEEAVRHAFPDGVLWVNVGQQPELTMLQAEVVSFFEDSLPVFLSPRQGKSYLSKTLADKTCLLILDDVWKIKHAAAFDALGAESRMLITTRLEEVVVGINATEYRLDVLTETQALALLRQASQTAQDESLPGTATDVAKECGYLPLALAMVGAMVRGKPRNRWDLALRRLRNADLEKIKKHFADYPYPDLYKAIHVSVEALAPQLQARYLDLAVFREGYSVPEAVFETFWADEDLLGYDPVEVIDLFIDNSLAHRGDLEGMALHDLQYDYVRKRSEDQTPLHNRLLAAYAKQCPNGWISGPDDGYFFLDF